MNFGQQFNQFPKQSHSKERANIFVNFSTSYFVVFRILRQVAVNTGQEHRSFFFYIRNRTALCAITFYLNKVSYCVSTTILHIPFIGTETGKNVLICQLLVPYDKLPLVKRLDMDRNGIVTTVDRICGVHCVKRFFSPIQSKGCVRNPKLHHLSVYLNFDISQQMFHYSRSYNHLLCLVTVP